MLCLWPGSLSAVCPGSSAGGTARTLRAGVPRGTAPAFPCPGPAQRLEGNGCLLNLPIPGRVWQRRGGNVTPGVRLLGRADFPAAGSGRALWRHIDHCSALSQDTVSSPVARAHPSHAVKEKSSAL